MEVEIRERYVNPYTDFGFKKLFGTELNKDLLISFLNALFKDKPEITDLTYLNGEHLGDGYQDRRAVFDVYCKLADDSRIIVEMQKTEQAYFKDRSIYYSTFPIREQGQKGDWNYHLQDVYTVGILNFNFPEDEYPADSLIHEIKLKDVEDNHIFYDKLTFVYLEMPKFKKREDELETMFDKWMFALTNLSRLLERPKALQERIFTRLFEQAEVARFTPVEREEYVASKKDYWDLYSSIKTSFDKGKAEGLAEGEAKGRAEGEAKGRAEGEAKGRAEGLAEGLAEGAKKEKLENARKMKGLNIDTQTISRVTGLDPDDIDAL
jgi:predicted transposase/invertase (TIGR01784 family)